MIWQSKLQDLLILSLIAAVSVFYQFNQMPPPYPWADEAGVGYEANLTLAAGPRMIDPSPPGAIHDPHYAVTVVTIFLAALIFKFFGPSLAALRLISGCMGVVSVVLVYLLAHEMFWRELGQRARYVGLAAAGMMTVSLWFLGMTRLGWAPPAALMLSVIFFYWWWRALNTGRLRYFAIAGLFLALAQYGHITARFIPIALVGFLTFNGITMLLARRGPDSLISRYWRGLVVLAAITLLGCLPIFQYYLRFPGDFTARARLVSPAFAPALSLSQRLEAAGSGLADKMHVLGFDLSWLATKDTATLLSPLTIILLAGGLGLLLYRGVFMSVPHATDDKNGVETLVETPSQRSAEASTPINSICEGVFTNLWHATSDEKPSPRRWRDSPLPLGEGLGVRAIFLGECLPYQFLLAGWVVLSAPAWLSKIGDNTFIAIYDYARRGILIMPLTFIIAGLFLTQVGFWLQERVKPTRNNGRLILTLLIGAILITAFTDYQAYFGRWQADPYLTQVFSPRFIPVVQKLKELAQPEALFIFPINASKDTTERPDLYTLGFLYQGKAALALTNNYEASLPQKLTALIQNRKIVYLLQFTDQDDPKQAIAWWLAAYGKPQPVVPEVPGYKVSAFELNSTTEDLTNLPQPITLTIPFGRQAQLVGYRYGSNVSRQGFTLQKVESAGHLLVNLSWQVMGEDAPDYNTAIILRDAANQVIAQTDAPLLNLAGLTSNQWLADETEQIYLTMPLPIGLAPGQYWLDVVLYEGATLRRETPVTTQGDLSYRLGLVTVLPAANPAELTPQLASVVSNPIEISPALRLAGTSLPPAQTLSPGDLLQGVLYWQALTPLADDVIADYVLIRANDRLTVSLAQTIPLGGLDYPTHRWRATEIVADYLTLQIPPDVPSGTFWLGIRLTHGIGQTLAEIPLSQVTITAWERLFNLPTGVSPLVRQFDNSIKLVGADLPETVSVNQTLPIRLFWQTDQFIQNNYKTFIHIFGENDQIIGQDDSIPGQGKRSTRGWLPGEVVEDYHEISLSADVTPGVYRVVIGLYDTVSGSRLAAQTHLEASEENSVLIGQVKIQ